MKGIGRSAGICFILFCFYNNDGSAQESALLLKICCGVTIISLLHGLVQPIKKIMLVATVLLILFNLFLGKKKFDFEKHLKLAIYYNEQKRFPETISEANSAKNVFFTIDITSNPVELNSGVAYKEMKNYDAALKELKTALSYSPYNNRTYNNLGAVYFDLKQYQNGIDSYKKSLEYVPEFETVLKNLAVTYYLAGDYAACIETMGKFNTEGDQMMINVLNDAKKKLEEKK